MLRHDDGASTATRRPLSLGRSQKVLIVNGDSQVLEMLEPMLDAGNYDVVFVEAAAHAYSQVKRVQPDLVILCVRMDDADGLAVLSMLKLDVDTVDIPVVTFTSAPEDTTSEAVDDEEEDEEPPMFPTRPAMRMN
jgi:two-component system alkaline phosphatase synthesis response regulator PhoP